MKLAQKIGFALILGTLLVSSYVQAAEVVGDPFGSEYPAASGLPDVDPRIVVARIIRVAMGLLGILLVCLIMYGGYLWMTAGGNSEQVKKAKDIIGSGIIGLAIILAAYSITYFVTSMLIQATAGDAGTSSSY